jgi:hypothetical protein
MQRKISQSNCKRLSVKSLSFFVTANETEQRLRVLLERAVSPYLVAPMTAISFNCLESVTSSGVSGVVYAVEDDRSSFDQACAGGGSQIL